MMGLNRSRRIASARGRMTVAYTPCTTTAMMISENTSNMNSLGNVNLFIDATLVLVRWLRCLPETRRRNPDALFPSVRSAAANRLAAGGLDRVGSGRARAVAAVFTLAAASPGLPAQRRPCQRPERRTLFARSSGGVAQQQRRWRPSGSGVAQLLGLRRLAQGSPAASLGAGAGSCCASARAADCRPVSAMNGAAG